MTGHPNLSDDINAAIAKSERDGGIWTKDVPPGHTVLVQTHNTLYALTNHGDRWIGQGGQRLPEGTVVHVNGSTFGGSIIKVGFIGIGMYLELLVHGHTFTTSAIESVEIRGEGVANGPTIYPVRGQRKGVKPCLQSY